MTHIEMIKEMAKMQNALDEALLEKGEKLGKIKGFDRERTTFALIDELGELVHELKGDWCWWKATQKPVDRQKVLEELVDVWHFALSLDNNNEYFCYENEFYKENRCFVLGDIQELINACIEDGLTVPRLYPLTYSLGFTMENVYSGYIKKNKENYERIKQGY